MDGALAKVTALKRVVSTNVRKATTADAKQFLQTQSDELQHSAQLAAEKGASSWLTCRPLKAHGFSLSKGEFRDGLALRYGWLPPRLPSSCVCGKAFHVNHALSCPHGGYPSLRHNDVRDVTSSLLKRFANNVVVEPHLQPIDGERFRHRSAIVNEQARLDVAASGIWGGRFDRTYLDVRVFNPFAASNRSISSLSSCYQRHEREKRQSYEERIREVEHSSFVPVVLSCTGGMGKSATSLYKRIADLLSEKTGEPYSTVMAWIRCRLSFSLLRSCVACLPGARRPVGGTSVETPATLAVVEANIHV